MSFAAYLKNIQTKTGKTPDDFRALAEKKGFTRRGVFVPEAKVMTVVKWLKQDFALGHGHAMAIVALLRGKPLD